MMDKELLDRALNKAGYAAINQVELWGILHIPSGKLLRQYNKGYGHTQLGVEDPKNNPRVIRGINLSPRLFTKEDTAKRALTQWLQGAHSYHWEDGFIIGKPNVPRIKEDMKVVPIHLFMENTES